MTITLELPPGLGARLISGAARRRQSVEDYLLALVERDAEFVDAVHAESLIETATEGLSNWEEMIRRVQSGYQPLPEERLRAIAELLQGVHTGISLTDEELSRERLYDD